MVHQIEEGNGMTAYELCLRHSHEEDDDVHVHFYCESCQHTFCLYNTPIPAIVVPNGFQVAGANYLVKGICPACAKKTKNSSYLFSRSRISLPLYYVSGLRLVI